MRRQPNASRVSAKAYDSLSASANSTIASSPDSGDVGVV
jgi:hypothetical protein